MPSTAIDAITAAFEHTKQCLFRPFRWGQWVRLAVVGLLAGEMGGGGSCNYRVPGNFIPSQPRHLHDTGLLWNNPALAAGAIAGIVVGFLIVLLLFAYVSSRMRFVLFDSIVARQCRIRHYWRQRAEPAFHYFLWQLLFGMATLVVVAFVVVPPLLLAVAGGWFRDPGAHLPAVIVTAAVTLLVLLAVFVVVAVVHVLTKDFVVPQMAIEGVTVRDGWKRLWAQMSGDWVGHAAYIGLKIVLTIATTIVTAIIGIILALIVLIPVGGFSVIAVLAGQAAGLTWDPVTISIAIAVGAAVVLALIFLFAMISVPFVVFYPAYGCYFLAGRYPPLHAALTPATSPPSAA